MEKHCEVIAVETGSMAVGLVLWPRWGDIAADRFNHLCSGEMLSMACNKWSSRSFGTFRSSQSTTEREGCDSSNE